jgi:SAM-dependent methyltransferase
MSITFLKINRYINRKIQSIIKKFKRIIIWGSFRRLRPFSDVFGYDRGNQSIARYYIDNFISMNCIFIQGNILEIGDNTYTTRHGTNVVKSDILHVKEGNSKATIVADLTCADHLPSNFYDCIIMPQTLPFIYDFHSALKHVHRILKPRGVLIVTLSGISQISRYDMDRWGDYWRFTSLSAKRMFEEYFPIDNIEINTYGNVLSAVAFLEGLASNELSKKELDFHDKNYEVIISVKAIKN